MARELAGVEVWHQDFLAALERGPMDEDELAWMRRVGDHIYEHDGWAGFLDGAK